MWEVLAGRRSSDQPGVMAALAYANRRENRRLHTALTVDSMNEGDLSSRPRVTVRKSSIWLSRERPAEETNFTSAERKAL